MIVMYYQVMYVKKVKMVSFGSDFSIVDVEKYSYEVIKWMHVLNDVTIGHQPPCLCARFFRMIRNFNWRYLENDRTDLNAVN